MLELVCSFPPRGWLRRMGGKNQTDTASSSSSDEALASRVRASGDAKAFALLVTRYRGRLIGLARRMLASGTFGSEEAEDVAQEAFVAAFDKRRSYRTSEPFRPWLYRIALNRCLDRLRVQSRRPLHFGEVSEPESLAPGPLQALLQDEQETRLREAVGALPEKYRAVFVLRHVDDLSYEEIGMITEQPLGTVKTQLFRARALLRAALAEGWGGEDTL
jgi:RNA polymerase sigma-70 factor (ECF subfamily)